LLGLPITIAMKPERNITAIHCCILFAIMQIGELETVIGYLVE